MPYYGFVGGPIKAVFTNWKDIERLSLIYPYCSYRRKETEAEAWDWVSRRGTKKLTLSLTRYGNIFDTHYVTIEYFITPTGTYYNVRTDKLGYVKLYIDDPAVTVENRTGLIMVGIESLRLNPNLIHSHLIAIQNILQIIGPFVDAEVIVPNHGVFYALTHYTGKSRYILRIQEFLKRRSGNVAWTLKEF